MREILFRGKNATTGEWVYGDLVRFFAITEEKTHYNIFAKTALFGILPDTVGEFTGLTDKNGKKIFEGDIVVMELGAVTVTSVVEYHGAAFYIATDCDLWEIDSYYSLEVIGNIHDNPELMEGNK